VLLGAVLFVDLACGGSSPGYLPAGSAGDGGAAGADGGGGPLLSDEAGQSDAGPGGACVSTSAKASVVPVDLVFMFDRSGSMDSDNKWGACAQGLEAFFGDPGSKGMRASLQYFPVDNSFPFGNEACEEKSYHATAVSMRPLPDAASFNGSINAKSPTDKGGTPTLPAIQGAIAYSKDILAQSPGHKVAIVLVTDGDPRDCGSDVQGVSNEAAAVAATIPTYVVGVGDLPNLDAIAKAGGTQKAVVVTTGNPQKTTQDLLAALVQIKGGLACSLPIPAPPNGEKLDPNAVNVRYTSAGGQPDTLSYDKSCANGVGWHYDNPSAPTKVELCPASCAAANQVSGQVDILFGCATKGGVK
jgi:hypothetical protein